MKKRTRILTVSTMFICFMFLVATASEATAKTFQWNVQSIFTSGSSLYKEFEIFVEKVKVMTNGRLTITPHPVGSIVGYKEMHDALRTGVLHGYFSAPTFQSGKEPAFSLICDLPGGYDNVIQFDTWVHQKGGLDLLREGQARFGNHVVGVIFYGQEVLPSKVPIRTMADLRGKKIRSAEGIIANLFTALGASTISIPGSEVYSALDKGVIDAADWGTRSMNDQMGLHEVAKYSIEPGFYSMSLLEFAVSMKAWNELPKDIQQILETANREWSWSTVTRVAKEDAEVIQKLNDMGVEIITLPEEDILKIREIARGLWEDWANKSPLSKKVADSHIRWVQELGLL